MHVRKFPKVKSKAGTKPQGWEVTILIILVGQYVCSRTENTYLTVNIQAALDYLGTDQSTMEICKQAFLFSLCL